MGSRNPSRNRTPLTTLGTSHTDMDLDLRRKELEAKFSQNNGDLNVDPAGPNADPSLRFRGQPSQEISQLGYPRWVTAAEEESSRRASLGRHHQVPGLQGHDPRGDQRPLLLQARDRQATARRS